MDIFDWIVKKSRSHSSDHRSNGTDEGSGEDADVFYSPKTGDLSVDDSLNGGDDGSFNDLSIEFNDGAQDILLVEEEESNHHHKKGKKKKGINNKHDSKEESEGNHKEIVGYLSSGEKREILLYYLLENFYTIGEQEKKRLYYFLLHVAESGAVDFDPFIKMPLHNDFRDQLNFILERINKQYPHVPQPQLTLYPSGSIYERDFEEISFLGKGGYGRVVKARKRMDGMMYAVKEIRFRDFSDSVKKLDKVLREVKALAQLDHVNVLRYYHAWLQVESEFSPELKPHVNLVEISTLSDGNNGDETSDSKKINFEMSPDLSLVPYHAIKLKETKKRYVLYIQMQLCEGKSLKDFLEKPDRAIDFHENMRLFSQVVAGIHHVHSRGLIHRDIKPDNIFLTADGVVKIGDFGLAKKIQEISFESSGEFSVQSFTDSTHTAGVGTRTYVSPEQLSGQCYNEKADIYSLGILLFELFCKFGTHSERANTLQKLRKGEIDNQFWNKYPSVATFVLLLMQENPHCRPSTSEVLKSNFLNDFQAKTTNDAEVFTLVQKQQEEILLLNEKIRKLEEKLKNCGVN